MINLEECLNKLVIITDNENKQWHGRVELYWNASDNEEGEDSIAIKTEEQPDRLIEFMQSEIRNVSCAE